MVAVPKRSLITTDHNREQSTTRLHGPANELPVFLVVLQVDHLFKIPQIPDGNLSAKRRLLILVAPLPLAAVKPNADTAGEFVVVAHEGIVALQLLTGSD